MTDSEWPKSVSVDEMYGEWDWEAAVAAADRSLDPRPSSSIIDMFGALGPGPGDVVLDIGGRCASHGLEMAKRFGCRVISVDPAESNIAEGQAAIAEHDFGHLVEAVRGSIEEIPADDEAFSFAFSRDMFAHVVDADRALEECVRVLAPGGLMLIHQVFATRSRTGWSRRQPQVGRPRAVPFAHRQRPQLVTHSHTRAVQVSRDPR